MIATLTLIEEIHGPDGGERFTLRQTFAFTAEELATEGIVPASAGHLTTAEEVEAVIRENELAVWSSTQVAESDRNDWGGDLVDFDPTEADPYEQRLELVVITPGPDAA